MRNRDVKAGDVDGTQADGCECPGDATDPADDLCLNANPLQAMVDNAADGVSVAGHLVTLKDEDWFRFDAKDLPDTGTFDAPGQDNFHVKVAITSPADGSIVVDVLRGDCAAKAPCAAPASHFDWYPSPATAIATGPVPCVTADLSKWDCCTVAACGPVGSDCCESTALCGDSHGYGYCSDDSTTFFVRVYRAKGFPKTCDDTAYALQISNGVF